MEDERTKRVVVVVGGGVGGALLAKELQFDADLYLIDPKEYFEIPWANLRAMVEPSIAERTLVNHTEYLTNGRIVTSQAVGVTDKEVLTVDGRTVAYDYLVIATGHVNTTPRSRRERMEQFQQDNHKIKSSSSVLIIGGGPTGVELAGEIAVDYPEKKVTLVHRGSRLLEFIGPKASKKALDWLTLKKVEVLLGQTVDLDSMCENERVYTTSGGEKVTADCHFVCVGKPLGSSWLQESILKECLDNKGRLMVDENLRVGGRKNIFAIGDITDIPEIKQGYLAQKHAWVVAKNLKLLMKGAKENKLEKYKPSSSAMAAVSLGRKEGIAELPFATISGCLPGFIKSRDLFVGKTRKQMGLDPHPTDTS
ncbi:apoptosis-inducing factor-like protein B-like [Iris pallida]|uniref:Apoptosis-inducing factor-like protein B-like n=1 Tax=Iris pallida TaxID=29817 RepID=A0AAX6GU48_IRIPA|nr:apoptosis-inducing factor-like protein B-like [Iris pallida]KAJ6831818.1 apoptosis-inducing factor-like protein B-like [Iris pallida]